MDRAPIHFGVLPIPPLVPPLFEKSPSRVKPFNGDRSRCTFQIVSRLYRLAPDVIGEGRMKNAFYLTHYNALLGRGLEVDDFINHRRQWILR